ncbi:MAG: DUF3726 domain-containing protein [Rhodobacteraceae bacterium]|nr:MAG: DUF3726 domain-containing protein [Paracoccaceae bacterium]
MTPVPHDQTRGDSTPFFRDAKPAPLSRNEVASLCMKAARGAGMSWGMAEEAGFAAAWLAAHGIDGPAHLAAHLEQAQGRAWAELCPRVTPGDWRAAGGGTLCPIVLGATLCDHAALAQGPLAGCSITLGMVDHPILLLPFLAEIARLNKVLVTVTSAQVTACIDASDTWMQTATEMLSGQAADLTLTAREGALKNPPAQTARHTKTSADTIAALNAFAMRTTVPASEQSRAGAGSTLGDND